jgi:hypothetical protein
VEIVGEMKFVVYARPQQFPLPAAFAFGSGAIASKRSEDRQEEDMSADYSPAFVCWLCEHRWQ